MTEKNDLAQVRTDWAEDRTVLANERTFAGWMRTGMAALGLAVGLKAVFGDFDPKWLAKSVATIFVAAAIIIFWSAAVKSRQAQRRLSSHKTAPQGAGRMFALASIMTIGAASIGVVLWLL